MCISPVGAFKNNAKLHREERLCNRQKTVKNPVWKYLNLGIVESGKNEKGMEKS